MFLEIINIFSHVYSQLTRKWVPLADDLKEKRIKSKIKESFGHLRLADWRDLLFEVRAFCPHLVKELHWYLEQNPTHLDLLVKATYDQVQCCLKQDYNYIPFIDEKFPDLLKNIDFPPLALTVEGDVGLLKKINCAVIGSRKASSTAVQKSFEVGRSLAEKNIVVVSGGAFGCDIAAHLGVLSLEKNRALAIVVFAGGLNQLYPKGNEHIFRRLSEKQALFVSEKLCDMPCFPMDFPVRNRIISGLCGSIVIIQASEKSGALITAGLALDQGREVYVYKTIDGDIQFSGNKRLLEDGAMEFESIENLLVTCCSSITIP